MDAPILATPPPELVSLLEQLPGCRLLIDRHYRIVATNATFREHCHQAPGELVTGRRCYEVSHGYDSPCDQNGEVCPLAAATRSGKTEHCLHIHHTPCGPEHVSVEILPLTGASGDVELYMEHMEPLEHSQRGEHCVGRDPSFLATLGLIKRVASADTSVLLLGETGTGKEVMARALHDLSSRAAKPFVVVDCSGLTETLFESELFGHERGAFTGAIARKPGLVEAAAGGTLFIDELGDIPMLLQVKLLRLLETGLFRRVGGIEVLRADFRLVAATHRDLLQLVETGQFRRDLYYRISAFPVTVPPLRSRPSDIPALAHAMLTRVGREGPADFTRTALDALVCYRYPGNVRELRNIVERAALLADGDWIDLQHLPECVAGWNASPPALEARLPAADGSVLANAERDALRGALQRHAGSRRELAVRLGLSERTLYRKLREFDLS
jgi:transcriptional regulator with PAS, ATPase and Fis domain